MDKVTNDVQEPTNQQPVPYIHLEQKANGEWELSSNIPNPQRVLRLIGAKLVLQNES